MISKILKKFIGLIESLSNKRFVFLVVLLVVLTSLIWWPIYNGFEINSDAVGFHRLGINLAEGRGFYLEEDGGATMFRDPGYPFFLAVSYKIFGVHPNIIRFEQFLLLFFICFLSYLIAKEVAGKRAGRISAILLAIFPTLNIFASYLFSEILAAFLLLFSAYVLIVAEKKDKVYMFGWAGLIFGALVLTKSVFLYLSILLVVLFLIKLQEKRFLKIMVFVCAFSLIAGSWIYRNYKYFDKPMIAYRAGAIMHNHAIKLTYDREKLKDFIQSALLGEYFVKIKKPDFNFDEADGNIDTKMEFRELRKQGKTAQEMDAIMIERSKELLTAQPFKFFHLGFLEVILLNTPMVPVDPLTQTFSGTNLRELVFLKSLILILIRLVWLAFLVLVVFGFFKILKKNKFAGFLIALYVFYINGVFMGLQGVPRLLLPVYPLYFILFVYSLCHLLDKTHKNRIYDFSQ
ncbi:glycosyltransferase family 39 protein [Patescibacteria group bacterium]|nr:glycosyltransferase family 39 protein [Patescibacteria group bacterium]MBU4511770.1 glycosyltransferase family 39 protein [Patescibacteria group bacterium]